MHVGERFEAYLELNQGMLEECSEQFGSNFEKFGTVLEAGLEKVWSMLVHARSMLGYVREQVGSRLGEFLEEFWIVATLFVACRV